MPTSFGAPQPQGVSATITRAPASQSLVLARTAPQGNPSLQGSFNTPHKIFVWDPNGVYVDCYYPNPQYGHFLNHQTLKGACVLDLFPRAVGRRLKTTIHRAWKTHEEQRTRLVFERDAQHYEAAVTCVPTQEGQVIGFVTDRLVSPCQASQGLWRAGRSEFPMQLEEQDLTPRQYNIVQEVMRGQSNLQIAIHLGIKERTVKSHLHKIYDKLGVVNRVGLLVSLGQQGLTAPHAINPL